MVRPGASPMNRALTLAVTCAAMLSARTASADIGTYTLGYVDKWSTWVEGRKLGSCGARAAEIARTKTLDVAYDGVALFVNGERWTLDQATTKKLIVASWPNSPAGLRTSLHLEHSGNEATAHVNVYRLGEAGGMTCSDVGQYAGRFKKKQVSR
jgi:hypothetical protein